MFYLLFFVVSSIFFLSAFTKIHSRMLNSLLKTPLSFFHTNPSGRILNRFSKDLGVSDFLLIVSVQRLLHDGIYYIGAVAIICATFPYLIIATLVLFVCMLKFKNHYISSSREIRRFDGITKSPVNEHFSSNIKVIHITIILIKYKKTGIIQY